MIERAIRGILRDRLKEYPAVALTGPRQCGKTTLARTLEGSYYDLELASDRLRLDLEWTELVAEGSLVILDEAQAEPEVFPRIRAAIDAAPARPSRFLLLGSVAPFLMRRVSESLAGRLSLVEMGPFGLDELPEADLRRHWLTGGFPAGVLERRRFPRWHLDYLDLLVQRDLAVWGLPATAAATRRLLRMCAASNGQAWNASQIGQSLGISYHTVDSYMDYLEGAYLLRRLEPFQANLRKRLTKRPRLYWRDTGLLHASLGVKNTDDLLAQPWVGASWEGYVIEQILATLRSRGIDATPFFFRTSDQYEADLLLDFGTRVWVFEVKLTSHPTPQDMARLESVGSLVGADRCFLVSQTARSAGSGRLVSCDLRRLIAELV